MYTIKVETSEIFSNNLAKLRKGKGLSQRELARITNISYRMINHYENNPTSVPINKIKILADALDVRIGDLFNEQNEDETIQDLDVRWIKKIREIKDLPESDRKEINKHISSLVEKQRLKGMQEKTESQ